MSFLLDKFLEYVKVDTTSKEENVNCPSTDGQFVLATIIKKDLKGLGFEDIKLDSHSYLTATLKGNTKKDIPTIGFISHIDTAPSFNGKGVNPRIIGDYNGEEIVLNKEKDIVMSPKDFPELKNYKGQDLIVTDGTTLLGADDKAGVVEIMAALKYLKAHPEIEHGDIRLCFTPDEEIGRGSDKFDVKGFNADFAYTIDGGELGELEYENFNAASAEIRITGKNIHPGTAKNKMINSLIIAMEINSMLPVQERPEHTEKYEGFFLLKKMEGIVEETSMHYIIRDHSMEKFNEKKEFMKDVIRFIESKYKGARIELNIKDSYYNMKEKIEPEYYIIELAKKSMEDVGVVPKIKPIRGGTDGARLSYMGLPCPNIFTGGHNFHGKYEYIPIQSMEKAVEVIVSIIKNSGGIKK
ncbi:peptidase T [Fusobacterium sp. MFO224]|uniref:peptidase T n=1 Tax=Fusobacterium sp. MFO224 TaxID=3378070 RepID=UPI00385292B5